MFTSKSTKRYRVLFTKSYLKLLLKGVGQVEALSSTRHIFNHVFRCSNFRKFHRFSAQFRRLSQMVCLRASRMPVQYVIKEWNFRDLHLKLCPPVLIPRPETEDLIDIIMNHCDCVAPMFLEVGCGSGAIVLSLLKHYPSSDAIAIDLFPMAIQLTEKNASVYELQHRLRLICISFEQFVRSNDDAQFDFIVSNPPYIKSSELTFLDDEVLLFESSLALDGGMDGLGLIKKLLTISPRLLKPKGPKLLFLEIGHDHFQPISNFIRNNRLPVFSLKPLQDFSGHLRYLIVKYY